MKHFNFIVNRICANTPPRCSKRASRFVWVLVLMLTLGVGQMWGGTDAIYTVSTKTSVTTGGTAPAGSSASYSQDYNTAKQLTQASPNATLTLSGYTGKKITGVKLNMKRTNSKTANVQVKVGTTTIGSNSSLAPGNNYGDQTITLTSNPTVSSGQNIVITIAASGSSIYIDHYTITWEDVTPHDVSFDTGTGNPSVAKRSGTSITLPTTSDLVPTCYSDGWELYGWATAAYGSASTTATPTTTFAGLAGSSYSPANDITLFAVYKRTEDSNTGTTDVTFTPDDSGGWNTTSSSAQTGTKEGVTISATAGAHNTSNGDLRVNKNATFTVSSSNTISSIVFTRRNYDWSAVNVGEYSGASEYTWTGSANSVSFTAGNGQVQITNLVVTISGGSTTYYWSNPTCCTPLGTINGSFF